jgi:signal transduction histidine kinase/CheY-like chemotaxis protein
MRNSFIDRLLLPTIVGLSAFVGVLILWQRLLTQQGADIQTATKTQALFVKNKMESDLSERILPLELLGERWQVHSKDDNADLESDASLVMSRYPVYRAISWIDPTFNTTWVSPQRGSQGSIGTDLWSDARTRTALRAAADSRRVTVTRTLNLQHGETGLLVCVPVFPEEKLDGFLGGVLDYHGLFDSMLENVAQDYWLVVYDSNQEIYSRTGTSPRGKSPWAEDADIEFRQLSWRVRVWPKSEKLAYARSPLPRVTFVGGILLAGLLAFAVFMAESAQLQARQVETTNQELNREIANRKQTEERLRQAQKIEAIGQLAGGVAHNFNNMLMVIRGRAALSLNRIHSGHPLRRELNEIVKTTDRAASLTRQLLAFSRKQMLQLRVLDLNTLINQMAELLPPVLGEDIHLIMDLDPQLGRVRIDAAQMEQVIMNLVFNARDAMPAGGGLTITTANTRLDDAWVRLNPGVQPGPHVVLAVRDTGFGMDADTQARMFDPFFTTKDRNKGTGLGLSTVYGTIDQSGGSITVSSKPGEGTTIQIFLPRVEETIQTIQTVELAEECPGAPFGEETILVVEDDDAVRRMTREFLTIKGYTVKEARSGVEAIEFLGNHAEPIDLVLTDVIMPGMKGRELGGRLAAMRTGIKILYMSAHTEETVMDLDMLAPGTAFIEKPFSPEELASKVREVLVTSKGGPGSGPLPLG